MTPALAKTLPQRLWRNLPNLHWFRHKATNITSVRENGTINFDLDQLGLQTVCSIFFYRDQVKPDDKLEKLAHGSMMLIWTWWFFHMINYGHTLLGEDPFPDPATFTDAELGIQ